MTERDPVTDPAIQCSVGLVDPDKWPHYESTGNVVIKSREKVEGTL